MNAAVTMADIKAAKTKLAELTAAYQTSKPVVLQIHRAKIELQPGERYAGLLLDECGKPSYHLILMPGKAEAMTWKQAMDWAKQQGGELPTRREQSLLFANLKSEFSSSWYWSGEHYSEDNAWLQFFGYGSQNYIIKKSQALARFVRRLVIQSFNPLNGTAFEFDGNTYKLEQMLQANGDDESLCAWAKTAKAGDAFLDCRCIGVAA